MNPRQKRVAYIDGSETWGYGTFEELISYHATLATEYSEPLKVAGVAPMDTSVVSVLNQPLWFEPNWTRALRYREITRAAPLEITFQRPKWADGYDPPYPSDALIITQIVVYSRHNRSLRAQAVTNPSLEAVPLNALPAVFAAYIGSYGARPFLLFKFPEAPLPDDELWDQPLPPILEAPRTRPPVDSGVLDMALSSPPLEAGASEPNFAWGGDIDAAPVNIFFSNKDLPPSYSQPEGRLSLKIAIPRRTIALRAYAMPAHRIFPDLAPYQQWIYPGDTNEPVSPRNTFEDFPWLVDPEKYQP